MDVAEHGIPSGLSFFERPGITLVNLEVGPGIQFGIETVYNSAVGIGGAYGSWGEAYDNDRLYPFIAQRNGIFLPPDERMNLTELGFNFRHHVPYLSGAEDIDLETQVGAMLLRQAIAACGWQPWEVEGLLIGSSAPVVDDYLERIARAAGIPEGAVMVSIHKACDGSVAGLNLILNDGLAQSQGMGVNLAETLYGKKVLVGGIEGLSRFMKRSHDINALQLFGNGAGVIGVIPGKTMQLIAGKSREVFDTEGLLQVSMVYPFESGAPLDGHLIQVSEVNKNHYRVAGMMHTPVDDEPVVMAGLTGMVKLFVRTGVEVVKDVYHDYQARITEMGIPGKQIAVAIVHHANLKINRLKAKHLQRDGIDVPMPWLLSEFGNISAASNMIAFLRQLPQLKPGDHILIDGFGAGTYYDTLAVELGS